LKLPVVILLTFCGGALVTAGSLIGSHGAIGIGLVLWLIAAVVIVLAASRLAVDAWQDHKLRQALRKRDFGRDYRPGAGRT
jgi:hypothetical protein